MFAPHFLSDSIKKVVTFSLLMLLLPMQSLAQDKDKVALIIGIGDYQYVPKLDNPKPDAKLVEASLSELDFDTKLVLEADYEGFVTGVSWIKSRLSSGRPTIAVVYYAGHGVQFRGSNYLIPADTDIRDPEDLAGRAIDVSAIFDALHSEKLSNINIVVLDACRDNPFEDTFVENARSLVEGATGEARGLKRKYVSGNGLSKIDAPINTIVAYATAPGRVALDGDGKNSPYTTALVKSLNKEGFDIEQVFKNVRREVFLATDGGQIPWENSSLIDSFYFKPRKNVVQMF